MRLNRVPFVLAFVSAFSFFTFGQIDGARQASGPLSMDARMVYGRVALDGLEPGAKRPTVYVTLFTRRLQANRSTLDNDGYFYFRDIAADGGTLIVEVNGVEVARQSLLSVGPKQQRMDFYVVIPSTKSAVVKPGTISAKYAYERSKENTDLLNKAVSAVENRHPEKAIAYLKRIVESDPNDYGAWTILGATYTAVSDIAGAEAAFLTAIKVKPDSTPTILSLGKLYLTTTRPESAVEVLEKASQAEPENALALRLLGEAYLQVRKGTKAVAVLNEAIRLQPVEMAECHLMLARLYDIAGAKHLAAQEFKLFLEKVPQHAEKERMMVYIKDNPPQQ